MAVLRIYRGLPGSGKSTLAKEFVQAELAAGRVAVNIDRDMFRLANGFGVAPAGDFEDIVTSQQKAIIKRGLEQGWTVVESSTNLNAKFLKVLFELAENFGARVDVIDVDTPLEVCIERDENRRIAGGHFLGEQTLRDFANRVMPKGKFPALPKLPTPIEMQPYAPNTELREAVLVDLDETIARKGDRGPFDWHKVIDDEPIQWVIDRVYEQYALGRRIIFMSGRDEVCRGDTERWIRKAMPWLDRLGDVEIKLKLFMRKAGDQRRDAIVKYELFDQNIRNNYNVLFAIDDRKQVVDMWRSIGLPVMDVAGSTF